MMPRITPSDILIVIGCLAVIYGVWGWSHQAAEVVAGALLIGLAVVINGIKRDPRSP